MSKEFWWHSRLRIQHCHCYSLGHCCVAHLIPGPGTSACCRCSCHWNGVGMEWNGIPRNKISQGGVPIMVQWKQISPGTWSLRVLSLASLSGLRIRCCHVLWCRAQMWLGFCIAVAVAQAGSLSSNVTPTYAGGAALKSKKIV